MLPRSTDLIHAIPAGEGAFSLFPHTFNLSLVPHGSYDQATPRRWAMEHLRSLIPAVSLNPQGGAPAKFSLGSIEPSDLTVEALYAEGESTIVRIVENMGKNTDAKIVLGKTPKSASLTDFLGNELSKPSMNG